MIEKITFTAKGTICESCDKTIAKTAMGIPGVKKAHFDHRMGKGTLEFDERFVTPEEVFEKIGEKGYQCQLDEGKKSASWGWIPAIAGFLIIGYFLTHLVGKIPVPSISENMGLGLLFVLGLLTGVHCIAMCGGFVIGYTANAAKKGKKAMWSHAQYAAGKTLSYTIIGATFGLLGSLIAFTPRLRGFAGVLAGVFLVIFGLRMLGLFPSLRRFGIRIPWLAKRAGAMRGRGPLAIGLANGLMIACGPLQAIYIMAAGTGSMAEGAKMLFVFGLGTLPALLGFGALTSLISGKATARVLKASGGVVIILGLFMFNNGLTLAGTGLDAGSIFTSVTAQAGIEDSAPKATISQGYQEIRMEVTAKGWSPNSFVLEKGVPVHWVINGKEITSCNNRIVVPEYGLEFDVKPGLQTIEFTPDKVGTVRWSCWMGMIPGSFVVVEDTSAVDTATLSKDAAPVPSGGSCGCMS